MYRACTPYLEYSVRSTHAAKLTHPGVAASSRQFSMNVVSEMTWGVFLMEGFLPPTTQGFYSVLALALHLPGQRWSGCLYQPSVY